jgi:hypothetical protein
MSSLKPEGQEGKTSLVWGWVLAGGGGHKGEGGQIWGNTMYSFIKMEQ